MPAAGIHMIRPAACWSSSAESPQAGADAKCGA